RVSLSGVGVEWIYPQAELWKKMVVGKILKIKKHPNADKLKLVKTDIGSKKLEVVCGGSNLKEKMKVAVALSGAKIRWHGEGELVELKPTEIRGVKSEAMICAGAEIGLGGAFPAEDEHEIVDLGGIRAKAGTPLAEALSMQDTVFDVEVTTNRPDALSILGVAREAGTILKAPFKMPAIRSIKTDKGAELKVANRQPELCYRYQAVVIEGVKVKESPWWLKRRLMTAGTRSINNIVDITNLILWEMGQPLHAFDYKKLEGKKIIVRRAKNGEKIKALDELNYELKNHHLVIADGEKPIAIAGIMGGKKTGVTDKTKTIVLEAATFAPASVRKTSNELALRSESSNLFEKGLSTESTEYALARAVELIQKLAGGKVKSKVFDIRSKEFKPKEVSLDIEKANKVIGVELKLGEMVDILKRLGFEVKKSDKKIKAKAPYWREGDIEIEEDLIEEIARIYGYPNLPSVLPGGRVPDEAPDSQFEWERRVKNLCVSAGFNEVYNYSFISKRMLENMDLEGEIKLANPLSVDLEYMRPSLLPGLLENVAENENNFKEAKLFELSRVYLPKTGLPEEKMIFAGVIYGDSPNGELFHKVKGFVEELTSRFGVEVTFEKCTKDIIHPVRSYKITVGKKRIGYFGEIHPKVLEKFGVSSKVGFFDFDFEKLRANLKCHKTYEPLSAYPAIARDIALVVDKKLEYSDVEEAIYSVDELIREIELFDVYTPSVIPAKAGIPKTKKSIALHIVFRSSHRTLETKEVDEIWQKLTKKLKEKFKAEIRV
ncbi:phenylalanine--tRNA ligase subunit beta, partial [Patescibacteria group bacterium]